MPELLLEIFSEEIPARMQVKAEADLQKALVEGLAAAGLAGSKVASMSGPRRLTVCIEGLPARSADTEEERKGPKLGAPEQAVAGFLRGAGFSDISEAEVRSDPRKGDFYVAVRKVSGRATADIVADLVPQIIARFHWPKSMRTGTGDLRWVRPIQRILCVFDGKTVVFTVGGIASSNLTEGHRVHGRGPFKVANLADYVGALGGEGHVMLTRADRRTKIETDARAVCKKAGLELVEDAGLLEEVTGLAEWPQVILGDMDAGFLELPAEVIQLSMRTHQKYFAVRDPKTGKLAPHFVVVANIEASDGGKAIAAGNRKVLSARLDDGRFFWDNDKKTGLKAMAERLGKIDFKQELGTIADKVERVAALARELAPKVGADPDLAVRAARLCKADLVSEMVDEFPELQGVMGRYYALEQLNTVIPAGAQRKAGTQEAKPDTGSRISSDELSGMTNWAEGLSEAEITQIANAIADHYKPQGPSDAVPSDPVAIAVALADKLDTLVGFWAIDEKPTGSKDPFALRRAALGVVRIVLENGVRLGLNSFLTRASLAANHHAFIVQSEVETKPVWDALKEATGWEGKVPWTGLVNYVEKMLDGGNPNSPNDQERLEKVASEIKDLLAFFADRLKQYLKDHGQRHDLIDAVFALGTSQSAAKGDRPSAGQAAPAQASAKQTAVSAGNDDLVLITKRVEALGAFLETEDGANLLAGYKRAANILKAEEKKDGAAFAGDVDEARLEAPAEKALFKAITAGAKAAKSALDKEDFAAAMSALASLRVPVDEFFDGEGSVMVNADDPKVRTNRLNLLNQMRVAIGAVADFGKIAG